MAETQCPTCGGIGQVQFFQGVSRFLLTAEECPECAGIGVVLDGNSNNDTNGDIDSDEEKMRPKG